MPLTQDSIEEAEKYILEALLTDDFRPAQRLAQGSFIRGMEEYRALSSEKCEELYEQEIIRAKQNDKILYQNIGWGSTGQFLRLCYNNYIIDLHGGMSLFLSMAAVKSGEYSEEEKSLFEELRFLLSDKERIPGIEMNTAYDYVNSRFVRSYVVSSFLAMAMFEFSHIAATSVHIRRCQNPACCLFFTSKRSDALYCENPAPQNPGLTCRQFYPKAVYRTKKRNDELEHLTKNAIARLGMSKNRHPEFREEIEQLLHEIKFEAFDMMAKVQNGTISIEEYKRWLNTKRIDKDAIDFE